ncbi:hypothetical protein ACWGVR_36985, partial [Streptomyces xanthophaeus]
ALERRGPHAFGQADPFFGWWTRPDGTVTGALIETTYADTFRVTLPAVRLDEGPPTVDGFGVVKPTFNFTGLYDGTNQPKIEIISTEATL